MLRAKALSNFLHTGRGTKKTNPNKTLCIADIDNMPSIMLEILQTILFRYQINGNEEM